MADYTLRILTPEQGDDRYIKQEDAATELTVSVAGEKGEVTSKQLREAMSMSVSPVDFGAAGDGATNDSAAIQQAITWLENNGGGDLIIPRGRRFRIPDGIFLIRNSTVPVNLIGQGGELVGGTVTVGPVTPGETIPVHGMRISGVVFDGDDAYGTRTLLNLGGIRGLTITDECVFKNAAIGIGTYGDNIGGAAFHSLSMLRINKCRFTGLLYAVKHAATVWDYASDWDITDNFVNYAADTSFWIASENGSNGGVDGLNFQGNTMFHVGTGSFSTPQFQNKRHNLRVGKTDWLRVINNNFFEAGTEAVLLRDLRDFVYIGNHIAWAGQRVKSDMLRIENSSNLRGVIDSSVFSLWSRAAIGIYQSDLSNLEIGSNIEYRFDPENPKYVGTSVRHTYTINGSPTGGVYRLGVNGTSTPNIAYNADAATVQTAIQATAGGTGATVTGTYPTFQVDFPTETQLRVNNNSLTGGSGVSITYAPVLCTSECFRVYASDACSGYPNVRGYHHSEGVGDSIRSTALQIRDPQGDIQGFTSAKVYKSVPSANTPIFALTDIVNVSARAGGLVHVTARRQGMSNDYIAHYLLFVSVQGSVVTLVASGGRTTGANSNEPSFTWAISGNNLCATRVGSVGSSATFYFDAMSAGTLMLK